MSKQSQKFKVPDELANLYDFANSLDVRRFTHQGVQHRQDDELKNPQALTAWMVREMSRQQGWGIDGITTFQRGFPVKIPRTG